MTERELIIEKIDELEALIRSYYANRRVRLDETDNLIYRKAIKLSESAKAHGLGPSGQVCPTCNGSGRI